MSIQFIIFLFFFYIIKSQSEDLILHEFSEKFIDIDNYNITKITYYFEESISKKEFSYQIYLVDYEEDESGLSIQLTDNESYTHITLSEQIKTITHKSLSNTLDIAIKQGFSATISIIIESTERNYEVIMPGIIGKTKKKFTCFNIPDNKIKYVLQFIHNDKEEEIYYDNNYYNIPFFLQPKNKSIIPNNTDLIFKIDSFTTKDYFSFYYIISSNNGITYHFNSIFENNDLKEKTEFVLKNGINKIKLPSNNYHKKIIFKFFSQIINNDDIYITLLIDNKKILENTKTCNKKEKCFINIDFSYPGNNNFIEIENHNNITFKYEFTNNTDPNYYPTDLSSFQIFLIILLIVIIIGVIGGVIFKYIKERNKITNQKFETFTFDDTKSTELGASVAKVNTIK